jgi:hypothetical protein
MRSTLALVFLSAGLFLSSGCGRHVVVEPSQVGTLNASEWTVKSTPHAADESDQQ